MFAQGEGRHSLGAAQLYGRPRGCGYIATLIIFSAAGRRRVRTAAGPGPPIPSVGGPEPWADVRGAHHPLTDADTAPEFSRPRW